MKQRVDYIDLAKGFCILLIILHHVQSPINELEGYRMLTCFRIPLYFVLSGLFFKKYDGLWNFILRKTNKLLIPFIFFLVAGYLIFSIGWAAVGQSDRVLSLTSKIIHGFNEENIYINTPVWFLFTLFQTSVIFYVLYDIYERLSLSKIYKEIVMAVMCFTIGIGGYILGFNKINLPFWVDTSLTAIPFYYTGYFLRVHTGFLIPNKYDKYIPLMLVGFALIVYFCADNISFMQSIYHQSYVSFYAAAMCGTFFVLLLSKLIKKIYLISFIGRYSVIVLGTHNLILLILRNLFSFIANDWLQSALLFVLTVIISVPVIKFLLKYFPKFVSQKDLIKVD